MIHGFLSAIERVYLSLKLPDYIGLVGSGIVVTQYFLSITGRIDVQGLAYPVLNIIGCLLIGFSLMFHCIHPPEATWTGVEGRADMDAGC